MDNLRKSIQLFFGDTCPDKVIQSAYRPLQKTGIVELGHFLENGFNSFTHFSLDEIQNVHQKISDDWLLDPIGGKHDKSIYNLLTHFNRQILLEDNQEPFVQYQHLLKWRELSYRLGEDLFTCAYFAYEDNRSQRIRRNFSWRSTVFSNNKRLKQMLNKGLAENHFHLKGSGPVFDLSWLSLMNGVTSHQEGFDMLKNDIKLHTNTNHAYSNSKKDLRVLVYKAAYIRQLLFRLTQGEKINVEHDLLKYDSNTHDSFVLLTDIANIQNQISELRYLHGHIFRHFGKNRVADYAIPKNLHEHNFKGTFMLCGERKLVYDCFNSIYRRDKEFNNYQHLFHAYLLIKSTLRSELIQVNNKVGFSNFLKYQDRKEHFLKDNSIYHTAFVNMAVNETLKYNTIKSFETRIAPKNKYIDLSKSLNSYNLQVSKDAIISKKEHYKFILDNKDKQYISHKHFFTVHFIKKNEKKSRSKVAGTVNSRHQRLRYEVKHQAMAIVNLRDKNYKLSELIRGIDAASSEFAAKPEVFAQAFRFLKNHKLKGVLNHLKEDINEHSLYATYHVGEDFYDLVDGIRSISEAILFLNLSQGDRLGHALALGINVADFYAFKEYKLMLPKEIVLDNIVWLLATIRRFGIESHHAEVNRLEKTYEILFHEIYTDNFDTSHNLTHRHFSHSTFYDAWKLRGDDPQLYLGNLSENIYQKNNLTYWERCRINPHPLISENIRKNIDVKFLYQQYHFNTEVKSAGLAIKQFIITHDYVELVSLVQQKMMENFRSLNIGIETNPTSNYLISTFNRYANHPLSRFFNLGLETDPAKILASPQLSVSINTDDQGIFSTSLENEYALMAIAMEKEKTKEGKPKYSPTMIYDWLDRIREMGMEQSFKDFSFQLKKSSHDNKNR
jgi:adenosine deaminase